jgi:ADP-ribose pyrophosphatase
MRSWQTLQRSKLFEIAGRVRVEREAVRLPDGRQVDDYLQLYLPDFVVVFAETPQAQVICLRQYKHGPRRVCVTLPAGGLEPGEDAVVAARRELREETGFEAAAHRLLGSFAVNGNQGSGTAHVVLATRCRQVAPAASGDLEEMTLELLGRDALCAALLAGEVAIVAHAAAIGMGLLGAGRLS